MSFDKHSIFGILFGYVTWLILLESEQMGGIIFRKDSDGNMVFSPINIWNMMLAPFKYHYFWKPEFWPHNWIIMCGCGIFIDLFIFS